MTEKQRLIRARLAVLNLAAEVKNVARACKLAGLSRSQFYALKRAYETYGEAGLLPRVRRKPDMPNRTPVYLEERILVTTLGKPAYGYIRLAREMKLEGIDVSPTMIRYVWQRVGLSTRSARLKWHNKSIDHDKNGNGSFETLRSVTRPVEAQSSVKASEKQKSTIGKDSGVDWSYWSQRVRESLTK